MVGPRSWAILVAAGGGRGWAAIGRRRSRRSPGARCWRKASSASTAPTGSTRSSWRRHPAGRSRPSSSPRSSSRRRSRPSSPAARRARQSPCGRRSPRCPQTRSSYWSTTRQGRCSTTTSSGECSRRSARASTAPYPGFRRRHAQAHRGGSRRGDGRAHRSRRRQTPQAFTLAALRSAVRGRPGGRNRLCVAGRAPGRAYPRGGGRPAAVQR